MYRPTLRFTLLAATLSLAAVPAFAAQAAGSAAAAPMSAVPSAAPGATGLHEPTSSQASNIVTADTRSDIAPALPMPGIGLNAAPARYLHTAQRDLAQHRTGAAQQALEMAETRLLDRSVVQTSVDRPDANPVIAHVRHALDSLGQGRLDMAQRQVDAAIGALGPQGHKV